MNQFLYLLAIGIKSFSISLKSWTRKSENNVGKFVHFFVARWSKKALFIQAKSIKLFLGWRGRNCSERNCLLMSCLNEGVCTAIYNNFTFQMDYRCACPAGHYGDQCEFKGELKLKILFIYFFL